MSKNNTVNVGNKKNEENGWKSLILDVLAPQEVHCFANDNSASKVESAYENTDRKNRLFASIPTLLVLVAQLAFFLELAVHMKAVALVNSSRKLVRNIWLIQQRPLLIWVRRTAVKQCGYFATCLGKGVPSFKKQHPSSRKFLYKVTSCNQSYHENKKQHPSKYLLTLVIHSKSSIFPNYWSRRLTLFEIEAL